MKRMIAIILSLLIVLAGCRSAPVDPTEGTTTAPPTADLAPSSDPEETTQSMQESTEPVAETTQPAEEITEPVEESTKNPWEEEEGYLLKRAMEQYSRPPEGVTCFLAGQIDDYSPIYGKVDDTILQKDAYYSYHYALDQCFLLADGHYGDREETKDHVYYVPEDETNRLYRSDYFGNNRELLYESNNGPITAFGYYGTEPNGKILLTESESRAVLLDLSTGQIRELMETEDAHKSYFYYFQYFIAEKTFVLVREDYEGYWMWIPAIDEEGKDLFLG